MDKFISHLRQYSLPIFLVILMLFLASCSTISKDGPPSYPVDESKIPDAVPKTEPLSKYGNKTSYRVFGKNYYVMKSSKSYHARGVASWYGTKFHHQRTSSGERYNMLAMTAAHRSLPLPTYVQVTNLKNGKKVIVKVNDRGPFESNRLIDLSYVAAKKLGMIGHGTTIVDVRALDPTQHYEEVFSRQPIESEQILLSKNKTINYSPSRASHHPVVTQSLARKNPQRKSIVYLQIGAFKNRAHAERLSKRLRTIVSSSSVSITYPTAHQKKLYRVQIGPIKDVSTAKSISKRLKAAGLQSKELVQPVFNS